MLCSEIRPPFKRPRLLIYRDYDIKILNMTEKTEQRILHEPDSTPQVVVSIQGFDHTPFNVQVTPRMALGISQTLALPSQHKLLYLEEMGNTYTQGEKRGKMLRNGFRQTIISDFLTRDLGRIPTEYELEARIADFFVSDDKTLVESGRIPLAFIQRYFLYQELDRLREIHDLQVILETHSPQVNPQLLKQEARMREAMAGVSHEWNAGNFSQALATHKAWYLTRNTLQYNREPEINEDWKKIIKAALRDKQPSALVGVFGGTHVVPLITKLQSSFSHAPVRLVGTYLDSGNSPELIIDKSVRNRQTPPDIIYARDMLIKKAVGRDLPTYFVNGDGLYTYVSRFEDIMQDLLEFADTLSLKDIVDVCHRQDFMGSFRTQYPGKY